MHRVSKISTSATLFEGISQVLGERKRRYLEDEKAWYNLFFDEVTSKIDERIFSVLYSEKMGRRNAPVRQLVGMMVLKEGNGWTDEQLFNESMLNMGVMRALGLSNINDTPPGKSTYYDFKSKLLKYEEETGASLLDICFKELTRGQILRYEVSGHRVRMDSKLISTNVKRCTRLRLIISTLQQYVKQKGKDNLGELAQEDRNKLLELSKSAAGNQTYKMRNEEKERLLGELGDLINRVVQTEKDKEVSALLYRLVQEQYDKDEQTGLTSPKASKEIKGDTLQSPHDEDAGYRRKKSGDKDQRVTGYSGNITETCDNGEVHLIVDVQLEGANHSDDKYIVPALEGVQQVIDHEIKELYTDGAYNSESNREFVSDLEVDLQWHLTAMQGRKGRYDFEFDEHGNLLVTDIRSGIVQVATKIMSKKNLPKFRISGGKSGYRYFDEESLKRYEIRKKIGLNTQETNGIRANVEASINQVFHKLNGGKTHYRGKIAHRNLVISRSIWVNYRRISNKIQGKGRWKSFFDLIFAKIRYYLPQPRFLSTYLKNQYDYFYAV